MGKRRLAGFFVVAAALCSAAGPPADALFAAARKGDAAAVRAELAKGVEVDAKWRYDTTALLMAARRGHVEVVKVLLEAGADAKAKDNYYGMTVLESAAFAGSPEVMRMVMAKGATGNKDQLLTGAIGAGKPAVAMVVLESGGVSAAAMSRALASATGGGHKELAEALKKAGAKPPPEVPAELLAKYAGTYRAATGAELVFFHKDGKFTGGPAGRPFTLAASDQTTFQPLEFEGLTIKFNVEGDRVVSAAIQQGPNSTVYNRVGEEKK